MLYPDSVMVLEETEYFVVGFFFVHYEEIARFETFTAAKMFLEAHLPLRSTEGAYFIVEY